MLMLIYNKIIFRKYFFKDFVVKLCIFLVISLHESDISNDFLISI